MVMAFLGVGFYAGLVATSPDMLDSLDKYVDTSNLYDVSIVSTLGLTDEDVDKVKEIEGIENVYAVQSKDSIAKIDDKESACKVIEYNENVNVPAIIAGRNIENENECLLDKAIVRTGHGLEQYIGKKILLENDDKNSDDNDVFSVKEFEIVGIVESPMYISGERENTSIGNGSISYYIMVKDNVINMDYYTGIYATVNGAKDTVTNSQEYLDDIVSGMAIPQIFSQATELGLQYSSYGDIRVTINDNLVISSITLPNVKLKEQSKSDPMKYDYIETNFVMHYYYKKLNNEWKLYYLYGEDTDDVGEYFNEIETTESKTMAIAPSYQSQLSKIYSFEKLDKMTEEKLNNIYNSNVNNVVFLNGYYNNSVIASANGFFINNGLIVTTWNFLEKALINGQYITIKGNNISYEVEGIVTANPDTDVAVIKVKNSNNSSIKLGDYKATNVEDPAIIISSKSGTGVMVQTGIVISNEDYIQTSIPLSTVDEGSPLFNQRGDVIGINTSKSTNTSISIAMNSEVLKEIQNKFKSLSFDKIETISFNELKEKYYYVKYNSENIKNSIPKGKWKTYSKIGNIEDTIKLELVKASYKDGIVSLRYKNSISQYINSMQLATDFKSKLISDGYEQVVNSSSKSIYKNKKYQVIIMDEFDYLIVVMVKL